MNLESGALDHSAILTSEHKSKTGSSHLGIEPRTFGLEVQRAILCANGTHDDCQMCLESLTLEKDRKKA